VGGRGRLNTLPQRLTVSGLIAEAVLGGARLARACAVLGFSERTFQRWQRSAEDSPDKRTLRHDAPAHKLSAVERATLLAVANSTEFGHLPPSQIVPRLADQQRYIASESTFYRILRAENQLAHRRPERVAHQRSKPRAACATQPNQLFTWDITYLPTTVHGAYFYLYLFLDVFSRKIVAWQIYAEESSANASEVMRDLCRREQIAPGQLVLHSDNGSSMKGATMLATLQALGVMASLSRPAVSNDNPYSESLFKTLKYRPAHPLHPFVDLAASRAWATTLVQWYNHEHRHSAIRFVTPAQRHAGLDQALLAQRHALYQVARAKHPLRWKRSTRNWRRVDIVHLNPDQTDTPGKDHFSMTVGQNRAA
jgi:transposase InsO family protein